MWNEKLIGVLFELGLVQSKCDHSLFVKSSNYVFVVLLAYVDDFVITGNSSNEILKVKNFLKNKFLIKDLGVIKYFLGIEVLKHETVFIPKKVLFGAACRVSYPDEQNYVISTLCDKDIFFID
jgi:hypothetical protein